MPTEEEIYQPGTIEWRNGRPESPIERLRGLYKDEITSKRKISYSKRQERRKYDLAYNFIIQRPDLAYARQINGLMKLIEKVNERKLKNKKFPGRDFWSDSGD